MTSPPGSLSPTSHGDESIPSQRADPFSYTNTAASEKDYDKDYSSPIPKRTPVFQKDYDEDFLAVLDRRLKLAVMQQGWRRKRYGSAAEDSPAGHTPAEVKEAYMAKRRAWEALWDMTSEESSDSDAEKAGERIDGRVGPGEKVAAPSSPRSPHQVDSLPTPPVSVESPLTAPLTRKRRRTPVEDNQEKEYLAKRHVTSSKEVTVVKASGPVDEAFLKILQQKYRRRPRPHGLSDNQSSKEVRVANPRSDAD